LSPTNAEGRRSNFFITIIEPRGVHMVNYC
jgi:hypothetical protein